MKNGDISNWIAPAVLLNVWDTLVIEHETSDRTLFDKIHLSLGSYERELKRYTVDVQGISALDKIFSFYEYRLILCTVGLVEGFSKAIFKKLDAMNVIYNYSQCFKDALEVRKFVESSVQKVALYFDADSLNVSVVGERARVLKLWSDIYPEL